MERRGVMERHGSPRGRSQKIKSSFFSEQRNKEKRDEGVSFWKENSWNGHSEKLSSRFM